MSRFGHFLLVACLLLVFLFAASSQAQDAQQWNNQYGTKGSLLGGIVVGSPSDLSAAFYNPAWIAHGDDPSFLMSTKAWELTNIKVVDGLASGTEPASSRVGTSPGFMAWRINKSTPDGWKVVISFLNRIRFDYNTSVTKISANEAPGVGENRWFVGEAYRHAKTDENWFGLTMARKFGDHISYGGTLFGVYRSQRSRLQISASNLAYDGAYSDGRLLDEFNYWHTRLLAKIGFAYNGDPFSFGLTLTTPSLGVMGSGSVSQQVGSSHTSDVNGAPTDAYLAADLQNDLDSNWESPVALALGASWKRRNTRLHFTCEWFSALSDKNVLEPKDYYGQSDGEHYVYQSSYSYRSILNFGFGIDHQLKEKVALFGSFRSDFSMINGGNPGNYLMSDWDIWHLSSGASFEIMDMELTVGLQYSLGNGVTNRYLNLGSEVAPSSFNDYASSDVDYRNLKLMVGFDFTFSTP